MTPSFPYIRHTPVLGHLVFWASHACYLSYDHDNACTCYCGTRFPGLYATQPYGDHAHEAREEGYESP